MGDFFSCTTQSWFHGNELERKTPSHVTAVLIRNPLPQALGGGRTAKEDRMIVAKPGEPLSPTQGKSCGQKLRRELTWALTDENRVQFWSPVNKANGRYDNIGIGVSILLQMVLLSSGKNPLGLYVCRMWSKQSRWCHNVCNPHRNRWSFDHTTLVIILMFLDRTLWDTLIALFKSASFPLGIGWDISNWEPPPNTLALVVAHVPCWWINLSCLKNGLLFLNTDYEEEMKICYHEPSLL